MKKTLSIVIALILSITMLCSCSNTTDEPLVSDSVTGSDASVSYPEPEPTELDPREIERSLKNDGTYTITANSSLKKPPSGYFGSLDMPSESTLIIDEGVVLTIAEDYRRLHADGQLINKGTIIINVSHDFDLSVKGQLINEGTIVNANDDQSVSINIGSLINMLSDKELENLGKNLGILEGNTDVCVSVGPYDREHTVITSADINRCFDLPWLNSVCVNSGGVFATELDERERFYTEVIIDEDVVVPKGAHLSFDEFFRDPIKFKGGKLIAQGSIMLYNTDRGGNGFDGIWNHLDQYIERVKPDGKITIWYGSVVPKNKSIMKDIKMMLESEIFSRIEIISLSEFEMGVESAPFKISKDLCIPKGVTLYIWEELQVTIPKGVTITVDGTFIIERRGDDDSEPVINGNIVIPENGAYSKEDSAHIWSGS